MYKTITITINKTIFYIEEEAYQILKEYLDSIKNHFGNSPDAKEILSDMESNIAEKFLDKTSKSEKIITKDDVLELIKVMGSVKDIQDESESNFSIKNENDGGNKDEEKKENDKEEKEASNQNTKKLYRNPDDVIIAGVCSGLSAYFGIDPVLVRLIFVISIFFGGTGILAYLILWLVMPEAKTSSQKLEMKGDPVTLKKIEENIRGRIDEYNQNENHENFFRKIISTIFKFLANLFSGFLKIFKKGINIFGVTFGIILLLSAIFSIFAVTFGAGVLLFNLSSLSFVVDFPVKEILVSIPYHLLVSLIYIVLIIPLVFMLFLSFSLIKRKNVFKSLVSGLLLGIWMLAIIATGIVTINAYPKIEKIISDQKSETSEKVLTIIQR